MEISEKNRTRLPIAVFFLFGFRSYSISLSYVILRLNVLDKVACENATKPKTAKKGDRVHENQWMRGKWGAAEGGEDGGKSTIAGWGDKLRRGGTSTALRAFKPGVKPGFISDLFTPGKQLTHGPAMPRLVSSVYSKQTRPDLFYLTNDPGIANHSRKKQFIPVKWTHSMSFWFKANDGRGIVSRP